LLSLIFYSKCLRNQFTDSNNKESGEEQTDVGGTLLEAIDNKVSDAHIFDDPVTPEIIKLETIRTYRFKRFKGYILKRIVIFEYL
jgi:hypothetical protein